MAVDPPDVAGDRLIRDILGMKTSRPQVVVMTGFGEPHIGLVRRAGADAVFTKPLEWSDLREQLTSLAARYRLPAIYPFRYWTASGGLLSFGVNTVEPFRQAADYIDRILKGTKPSDLPVQRPTTFEFTINLKAAKALGLTIQPALLARADEVIE